MAARFTVPLDEWYRTATFDYNATYTYMGWFYVEAATDWSNFLMIWRGSSSSQDVLQREASNATHLLQCGGGASSAGVTGGVLSTGVWTHYALVRESATVLKAYQNGSLMLTNTADTTGRLAADRLHIGRTGYNGRVAALKAWYGSMTAEQVAYEMVRVQPRRLLGLLWGWWPCLSGMGGTVRAQDLSGNGRDWAEIGSVVDADGPPVAWGTAPLLVRTATVTPPADVYSIAARQQSGADGSGHLGHRVLSY